MNASSLPHEKLMRAIESLGTEVAPIVRAETDDESPASERTVA